jgi:ribosome maturation factor RimP
MAQEETISRVRSIADSIVADQGMELVDVEYRREARGWVLRLYIDKEEGITLEDCTQISREVGRSLDVEDFILNPYTLEVSSPGLDRPLKKERDFVRFKDRSVRIKTVSPIENRRQFRGKLLGLSGEGIIKIEMEGRVIDIPLSNVAKANLELEI